jgi:nucleoside-diphosphate-sugar epimerase
MKIVVIGGTRLIGSKTVARLCQQGHEVIAASPNTGVKTMTGEGLAAALSGSDVVIDLANSPSSAPTGCRRATTFAASWRRKI